MREIIKKVFYENDMQKINLYIEQNKIQEKDIINIIELEHIETRWTETSYKIVLYHYEVTV